MDPIKCFWLEPTDQILLRLRRFTFSATPPCPAHSSGIHDASVSVGQAHRSEYTHVHGDSWDHEDQRWAKQCDCGYMFKDTDQWQFNPDRLYRRTDTDEYVTLARAPVGAMYNATWMLDNPHYKSHEGVCLMLKTPGGDWCVDGPSYNNGVTGPGWTRTGAIPDGVTAMPSIPTPRFHGWLRNGYLIPLVG